MSAKPGKEEEKVVCSNRQAHFNYFIEDTLEAGIVLQGTEVKSLRDGRANLKDSYAHIKDNEVYLLNCHISPYEFGNIQNHDPLRTRKLLLHRSQIKKLIGLTAQKGLTLVPLKIYFSGGRAKIALGIAKGKKLYDKRESLKEKEDARYMARALKNSYR
ncbi:MAG: SsrA-binding protein SmpB [Candidatus Schekmanbacteria bacterium]|nr:SsrA-binding protein SmpB [Candidatus Schekmanbacteria bacterium]